VRWKQAAKKEQQLSANHPHHHLHWELGRGRGRSGGGVRRKRRGGGERRGAGEEGQGGAGSLLRNWQAAVERVSQQLRGSASSMQRRLSTAIPPLSPEAHMNAGSPEHMRLMLQTRALSLQRTTCSQQLQVCTATIAAAAWKATAEGFSNRPPHAPPLLMQQTCVPLLQQRP